MDAYVGARRLRYHGDGAVVIIAQSPFLSARGCTAVREHVAEAAFGSAADYAYATRDVEVDAVPALRRYLVETGFAQRVVARVEWAHGVTLQSLDDLFVVKYTAPDGCGLRRHRDAGDVSFMIALSDREEFAGGGTRFDDGTVVDCDQGNVLTFPAALYHQGLPITGGERLLLVGFGRRGPARPGDIRLDTLEQVKVRPAARLWLGAVDAPCLRRLGVDALDDRRTFWIGADEAPRCGLEALAREMLRAQDLCQGAGAEFGFLRLLPRQKCPSNVIANVLGDEEQARPAVTTVTALLDHGDDAVVAEAILVVHAKSQDCYVRMRPGDHLVFDGASSFSQSVSPERPKRRRGEDAERRKALDAYFVVRLWPRNARGVPRLPAADAARLSRQPASPRTTYDPKILADVDLRDDSDHEVPSRRRRRRCTEEGSDHFRSWVVLR